MVVRMDKAWQHDFAPRPHHRDMRVFAAQIIIGSDFGDVAIFLDQCAIMVISSQAVAERVWRS
jgi:hypothetical protein